MSNQQYNSQQGQYGQNQQQNQYGQQNQQQNQYSQQNQQNSQQTQSYGQQNQSYGQQNQQQNQQLQQWFQGVDKNNSGSIDEKELQAALSSGGFSFSLECSLLMVKMFDANKKDGLNLQEFSNLYQYVTQMKSAFTQVDKDRSGSLSIQEVYAAIQSVGFQIQQQTFAQLFAKFDRKKQNSLGFDGYIVDKMNGYGRGTSVSFLTSSASTCALSNFMGFPINMENNAKYKSF
jgi:Ca2+-binding EF-hand superfamily protein